MVGNEKKSCISVAISRVGLPDNLSKISLTEEDATDSGNKENERARFLDGAFFEAFATVDEKQNGSIRKAKQETKKQMLDDKDMTDGNATFYKLFSKDSFTQDQAKIMYTELLYAVTYRLGKKVFRADDINDGDLFVYGQQALGLTREQHKEIYKEMKDRPPPKTFVHVTVVEGKNLEAKDANGLSDPYCMLSVINSKEGSKPSKDGKRVKKIVLRNIRDEDNVKLTRIRMNTLYPVWNEHFEFEVNDIENDVLRVDVWDKDDSSVFLDEDNRVTSIRGFSGLNRFFTQVAQSSKCDSNTMDDFLGIVEISVKDILWTGLDSDFNLEPRSHKSKVQGSLHLKVRLAASKENRTRISEESISTPMKFQRQLLKQFLRHEYEVFFNSEESRTQTWPMRLSDAGNQLFHQFAIHNSLTRFQEAVIKWEVYSRCMHDIAVPMDELIRLIDFLKAHPVAEDLDKEEEEVFIKSIDDFIAYSMELIKKHRSVFPPVSSEQLLRLGQLLLALLSLFKLPLFKNTYPDRRFARELEKELKIGTEEWFKLTKAYHEPIMNSDKATLSSLVYFTNSLVVSLNRARKKYDRLFKPTGVDYYQLAYNHLDKLLMAAVQPALASFTEKIEYDLRYDDFGTVLFELYLALKNFKDKKGYIPNQVQTSGPIDSYHQHFRTAVSKWLDLAKLKAIERIRKAVQLDEVRAVDSNLKYSVSAVDVTCCLGQICVFWKKLNWPDPTASYVFITQITDIISSCAMQYADIILDELKAAGYYKTTSSRFSIQEKICIMLNNLEHVLHFLDAIPQKLDFDALLMDLISEHGEERVQGMASTFQDIINCAQDDMRQKFDEIVVNTGDQLKEEIVKYLHSICATATAQDDPYELADGVLSYIDHNLVTLNDGLLLPAFKRCLIHIWEVFIFSMEEVVRKTEKREPMVFEHLRKILHIAQVFFYGDGNGIDDELRTLHSFESLDRLLSLYESSSAQVIEKYFTEKCEEQARTDEVFGTVTFKVFYSQQNKALHVGGLADPFVTVELLPKHLFKGQSEKHTKVEQETLFAIFDENFSFDISTTFCLHPGAALVLTVYDRDRFHEDDIAGEVFFDLNNVVGLDDNVAGGFSSVSQTELPLMHGSLIGQPFAVLMKRKDSMAVNFVKRRREKFKKMEECWAKARLRKLDSQK
eukprot:gene9157-10130_t